MNQKQKIKNSKFLSLILRHKPETINLSLDSSGWANVDELLQKLSSYNKTLSFEQLEKIVASCDKQRFRFNESRTRIRANQGHSLKADLKLKAIKPPGILYHGTASRFLDSIMKNGLQKQKRHHVHLSADRDTAYKVAIRHGKPVILEIDTGKMHLGGLAFYRSDNRVWLTESVPAKYIHIANSDF